MKLSLEDILTALLEVLGVEESYFWENIRSRTRAMVDLKQMFCLVAQRFGFSQPQIAKFLGFSNCVIHHHKKMAKGYFEYEKGYHDNVIAIQEKIVEKFPSLRDTVRVAPCSHCEVFKNHEKKNRTFALTFFCPIKNSTVLRDDDSCKWIVDDNLPF